MYISCPGDLHLTIKMMITKVVLTWYPAVVVELRWFEHKLPCSFVVIARNVGLLSPRLLCPAVD